MIYIIPIIICLVLAMVLGFIWYGPLFRKKWAEIIGADLNDQQKVAEAKKGMVPMMAANVVITLVTLIALSMLLGGFVAASIQLAVLVSVFLWLGFVMPTIASAALWSGKPKKLAWSMFFITAGYQLLMFVIYGVVFSFWI